MDYTEKELEIMKEFEFWSKDEMAGSKRCYDFGTRREGLTERVKDFLRTLGEYSEDFMSYGVEFKRG